MPVCCHVGFHWIQSILTSPLRPCWTLRSCLAGIFSLICKKLVQGWRSEAWPQISTIVYQAQTVGLYAFLKLTSPTNTQPRYECWVKGTLWRPLSCSRTLCTLNRSLQSSKRISAVGSSSGMCSANLTRCGWSRAAEGVGISYWLLSILMHSMSGEEGLWPFHWVIQLQSLQPYGQMFQLCWNTFSLDIDTRHWAAQKTGTSYLQDDIGRDGFVRLTVGMYFGKADLRRWPTDLPCFTKLRAVWVDNGCNIVAFSSLPTVVWWSWGTLDKRRKAWMHSRSMVGAVTLCALNCSNAVFC